MEVGSFRFAADDEVFAGHFPGNPIVPGALVLDRAVRAVERSGYPVSGVEHVKFFRPLRPGVPCTVELSRRSVALLKITCRSVDGLVLAAVIGTSHSSTSTDEDRSDGLARSK